MRDLQHLHDAKGSRQASARDADIASWAVGLMAMRASAGRAPVSHAVHTALISAILADSERPLQALLRSLPRQKIDAETLVENYVDRAARHLGNAWLDDRLGFAEVTIGCSRLQYILRNLGAAWGADRARLGQSGTVLLLTPPGEQHTLGAMSFMGQLRRRGISVALHFGLGPAAIRAKLCEGPVDAVMLSCSSRALIRDLADIAAAARSHDPSLPLIVGGGLAIEPDDLREQTGATLVTTDVEAAIRAAGLDVVPPMRHHSAGESIVDRRTAG